MGWDGGIVEELPLSYTLSSALSFQPRPVKLLHLFPRLSDSDFFFFNLCGFSFFLEEKNSIDLFNSKDGKHYLQE